MSLEMTLRVNFQAVFLCRCIRHYDKHKYLLHSGVAEKNTSMLVGKTISERVSGQLPEWTQFRMDTIPNGLDPG